MRPVAFSVAAVLAAAVIGIGGIGEGFGAGPSVSADEGDLAAAVLSHPSIKLLPAARADIERGVVDDRILRVLLLAAECHTLSSVGPLVTGHSYYVAGSTRPSNHAFGRAVDIPVVDGWPVFAPNLGALELARLLGGLPPSLRPDELGAPWSLDFEGVTTFTRNHGDHIHAGFDRPREG